ncbi:glycosyltransferase family 4 protein [Bradyrhizobium sp. 137]|uniref:glycosyltransferase family 4 protein n=1 Tax=Bradyrhizobium sp. 137 TaxID=2782614 RepID=UPI001FF70C65|nr:glycosyltransferase family 4 protein [Bradyrhizobium sp. 137]MCK1757380.1 glycosyltransferase family 4 protein [Bradyrhizobium sp. 137]
MNPNRRFIVAIGQIPPPTDGLAYITSEYVKLLAEDHDVRVLNISPRVSKRGVAYHLSRTAIVLGASLHLAFHAWRGNRACYMPCQSDFGLVYTAYLLAVARLFRYPTYLHHHNFGYINERRRMMESTLRAGGSEVVHIFLCDYMRTRFGETYGQPKRSLVISNAAFVSPLANRTIPSPGGLLRIGLLSNLNREKGLYLFLDLLRAARDQGLNIHGTLAGPVREPDDRTALVAAQKEFGERLHYAGPLYDDDKTRFYQSIDVFVFPTIYANEAQPTVLYEAMAAGNLVLAYERGCIASQIHKHGLIISADQPFAPQALAWLSDLHNNFDGARRSSVSDEMRIRHIDERERARRGFDSD